MFLRVDATPNRRIREAEGGAVKGRSFDSGYTLSYARVAVRYSWTLGNCRNEHVSLVKK